MLITFSCLSWSVGLPQINNISVFLFCSWLYVLLILSLLQAVCMFWRWITMISWQIFFLFWLSLSFLEVCFSAANAFRLIQSHFVIYGLFFIKSESIKNFSCSSSCVLFIFSQNFLYPSLHLIFILSGAYFVFGIRMFSNFILIFMVERNPDRCPPEWLLPIYILSISGGGSLVCTLQHLLFVKLFGNGHSYQCVVWYLIVF